jgi:hypothetical protein
MKKCEFCNDLDAIDEWDCPDEPHHGQTFICEECGADYYKEWGSETIWACDKQACYNHPEIKKL